MIVDITGTMLKPGNQGRDCMGNGENPKIECCCDECDYLLCCVPAHNEEECSSCGDRDCVRNRKPSP